MKAIITNSVITIALFIGFSKWGVGQTFPGGGYQGGGYGSGGVEIFTGIALPGGDAGSSQIKVYPNPFQVQMTIEFTADPGDFIELSVYDMNSRKVRSLWKLSRGMEGVQTLVWDGTNDQGVRLANGIYSIKLINGVNIFIKKVILYL